MNFFPCVNNHAVVSYILLCNEYPLGMSLHLLIIMQSSVLFNYMMITRCATIITSVLLYLTTNEHSTPINLFPCVKNHAVVSYM